MTLPNVVVAGAPKCGTTSLFSWLSAHPRVCASTLKETRFLFDVGARRLRQAANIHEHGLAAYEAYFTHCDRAHAQVILEATPGYLYQRTAPRVLSTFDSPPQILFLLRKPSDRVYSVYQSLRFRAFLDPTVAFPEYVERLREGDLDHQVDDAIERSQYIDYLRTWLEQFGRSDIHLLLLEQMRDDPRGFMKELSARFGIDPDFYDSCELPYKRPTQEIRRPTLHRAVARAVTLVVRDPDGKARRMLRNTFGGAYASLNVSPTAPAKTAEDREVLRLLDRHFAPYNASLAREFNIDLSAWQRGSK